MSATRVRHWPWQHEWVEDPATREADYWHPGPGGPCVMSLHRCVCGKTSWRHPATITRREAVAMISQKYALRPDGRMYR